MGDFGHRRSFEVVKSVAGTIPVTAIESSHSVVFLQVKFNKKALPLSSLEAN